MSTTDRPQVSRGLLVALGVVGAAAVVALLLFVVRPLMGGDELAAGEPVPSATGESAPEPGEANGGANGEVNGEANGHTADEPVAETFEVFTARDPFQQLVVAQSGGSGGSGGGGSPDPTETPTTPSGATVGATTIRLVDVFTDGGVEKILVTVNGTGYEVAEGETFAERFRVLDITGSCATLLFGDSRFTLCQGEEIRK